jgi:sugar O-acyltransferase (sialic acid O-acetyltransferase NeuD family)
MRIVLLGGGGHASDVLGALEALAAAAVTSSFEVVGFMADGEVNLSRFENRNIRHLGPLTELGAVKATHFVSCVGYPAGRKKLALLAHGQGLEPFTVVHPRAWMPPSARLGAGCVLLAGSTLSPQCRIGAHVHVGQGAVVGHDCRIGDFSSVMPAACISGDTSIGTECVIGANSTVIEGLSVGDRAVVGAGAVVTKNVPPSATAIGVPARFSTTGSHS